MMINSSKDSCKKTCVHLSGSLNSHVLSQQHGCTRQSDEEGSMVQAAALIDEMDTVRKGTDKVVHQQIRGCCC